MAYNQSSFGSRGSDVTELQKRLNENGYDLAVDGQFGKETQKAVRDYQKKKGLVVDGIVGKNTWASLLSSPAATPGDSTGKEILSGVSDETYDILATLIREEDRDLQLTCIKGFEVNGDNRAVVHLQWLRTKLGTSDKEMMEAIAAAMAACRDTHKGQ